METRTITVISASTNSRKAINTSATTLAELKRDLTANGIDYNNMSFYEGISKTELVNDDSQLPHDVMFKGTPTNNLVVLLTLQNKKIKSGALSNERKHVLDLITELGLNNIVLVTCGRNCTQVSTDKLKEIIEQATQTTTPSAPANEEVEEKDDAISVAVCTLADDYSNLCKAVKQMETSIRGLLEVVDERIAILEEMSEKKTVEEKNATIASPYSATELEEIVNSL